MYKFKFSTSIAASLGVAMVLGMSACSKPETHEVKEDAQAAISAAGDAVSEAGEAVSEAASKVSDQVDAASFIGKWTGPEGTYLEVVRKVDAYQVDIKNLDGVRSFPGVVKNEGLAFTRDGTEFTLRHGSGDATGMKWLMGKTDCVIVAAGEGYCRD